MRDYLRYLVITMPHGHSSVVMMDRRRTARDGRLTRPGEAQLLVLVFGVPQVTRYLIFITIMDTKKTIMRKIPQPGVVFTFSIANLF